MKIAGELQTAAGGGHDVFDGYVVEIRYAVKVDGGGGAYRDAEDSFALRNKDPRFFFELPDTSQLALDKPLQLRVYAPSGKEVFASEQMLATLLRSEKPLEIRIREVEPPPVSTPVQARGRLQWKDAPDKTSGFDGFSVLATFSARDGDDGDYQPRIASFTQGSGNQFAVPLPAREQLAPGPVALAAKYPDGQIAATASFEIDALREPVTLVVAQPQQPIVVRGDARADEAAPVRIKGKVVDLAGQTPIRNRQVILWGQGSGDGRLQPVLVATTDAAGNFAGAWPKAHFQRGFATVAGTRQANTDQALAVTLEPVAGEQDPPLGSFPTFVYLVVSVDTATDSAKDDDCACHDTGTPRQPDPEDLVANPNAYSQDIGPNCVNFTTPNRTLEEFVYTLVVRTTDPQIKGTTLSDLERRRTLLDHMRDVVEDKPRLSMAAAGNPTLLRTAITPAEAAIGNMATIANTAASTGEFKIKAVKEAALSPYAISKALPTDWANVFKTVAARGVLSADNSVDWDSSPTFYQAATIAHGHILYYKQIWKADGYSLGDLLYSLPLAPGQKKQIVIFDWDRTEYGRRDEDSHEDEALDSYLSHNRDVVDITHASLGEHMKGGSTSHTSGEAGGIGAGIGALLGPVMIGVAGGYSASSGSASSSAWQDSSRDVSASGLNQLRDMIQQGASAVRNQRSTVVQTARQTERFKVESEVVANHNHCHAITIEYFEVLRHYTIEQQLTQVQECLFIPLLMSSFDIAKVIRWRDILRSALLLPPRSRVSIFQQHPLQRGIDACERIFLNYEGSDFPTTTYASESLVSLSGELRISFRLNRPLDDDDNADDPARQDALMTMAVFQSSVGWNLWWPLLPWGPNETFEQFFAHQKVKYKNKIFEERVAPMLAEAVIDQLSFTAVSATGGRLPLQVDTTLVSDYKRDIELYCTVRPKGPVNVRRDQIDFIEISTSLDLSQSAQSKIIIRSASLRYSTPHLNGYLAQDYRVDNDLKPNDPVTVYTPLSVEEKRNPREEDKRFSKLLMEHLDSHLEHYHKAIWAQMDPDRRYMLLDGFLAPNANGKSVASVVENRVIGIAGNCLIMPVAPGYKLDPTYTYEPQRDERGDPVLDDRGNVAFEPTSLLDHYKPLVPPAPFRVSVPTRGVFAEAVMGACNSCEKWDESRYWKWEEHPIPEDPTPIAPIQTRPPERSDPGALTPTAFPTPMINIQNAPNAPDPGATLTGALGVLGKSDLFKDITGLDQTQKNALQAMLSNQESAKHFADKAAELAVQAQNLKSAPTTIDSIKKSMADGTIDKATGQRLIADAYRAQINGKTAEDKPGNTANASELGHAAADAVRSGREVKATQTHPDGTSTSIEQKPAATSSDGDRIDFIVPGQVFELTQPQGTDTCWATVATMMMSWKAQKQKPVVEVMQQAGPTFEQLFAEGKGLPPAEKASFISKLGLVVDEEAAASHDYDFYLDRMKAYGPLWITFDISDTSLALHARMLYGMSGSVTTDRSGILMKVVDPNDGSRHDIPFGDFVQQFEDVARETPSATPLPAQIVRFAQAIGPGGEGQGTTPQYVPVPTADPALEAVAACRLNPVQAIQQLQWYASQGLITLKGRSADPKKLKPIDDVDLGDTVDGVQMRVLVARGARNNTVFNATNTSPYPMMDVHPRNAVAIVRLIRNLKVNWPDLVAVITQGVNVAPANGAPKVIADSDVASDLQGYHHEGRSIDFTGVVLRSTQQPGDFDVLWIRDDWGQKSVPDESGGSARLQPDSNAPNALLNDWPAVQNTDAEAIKNPLKYRLDYLVTEPPAVHYSVVKSLTTKTTRDLFRDVYTIGREQYSPSQGDIGTYGTIIHPDYPLLGGASNGRTAHRDHIHMNVPHYRKAQMTSMWTAVMP
jgi:hypothetical protein